MPENGQLKETNGIDNHRRHNNFKKRNPEESARNESVSSPSAVRSMETKPHIKCIENRPKPRIPNHDQIHRSLKLTLDSGEFVCDPSKPTTHAVKQYLDGSVGRGERGEVESDSGYVWRGGGSECRKSCRDPEYIPTHPTDPNVHFSESLEFGKVENPLRTSDVIYIGRQHQCER